ncbi:MAG: HAMP domain-containing histidine kinase [Elusimicrobia bacterium]|nr:HAMP domain-containing histidine kinase [Elusimicrobiota bacterium]
MPDDSRAEQAERAKRSEAGHLRRACCLEERMVSEVAHELRSGLALVEAVLREAADGTLGRDGTPAPKLFELSLDGVRRMNRLVGELLQFSCLRGGRHSHRPVSTDVRPILERVRSAASLRAGKRGVDVRLDAAANLPQAFVDPELLEELAGNLADNAVRFARSEVVLSAEPSPADPALLRVTVQDDGPGVPHHVVASAIREAAPLVPPSSQSRVTTIGLSLCREIAERLGGRLEYERQRHATRFQLSVPVAAPAAGRTTANSLPRPGSE